MTEAADPVEGAAVAMERAIIAEMDAMVTATRELAARARRLGVGARAINGLQNASAVWSREFEALADKVGAEAPEVSKALLGREPTPMTEIVNHELAAAVAGDPSRRAR